jgi:hypothetical protein
MSRRRRGDRVLCVPSAKLAVLAPGAPKLIMLVISAWRVYNPVRLFLHVRTGRLLSICPLLTRAVSK